MHDTAQQRAAAAFRAAQRSFDLQAEPPDEEEAATIAARALARRAERAGLWPDGERMERL